MRLKTRCLLFLAIGALASLSCTAAVAQTTAVNVQARLEAAVKKIQDACSADIKTYCGAVTPGEGRLMLCVMAHEDKIGTQCDYALYEASRNLERALDRIEDLADACWNDIEKHCSNVQAGGGQIAGCLATSKASVSKQCQAVMARVPASK
jgi:Golgi apparatus protein 1